LREPGGNVALVVLVETGAMERLVHRLTTAAAKCARRREHGTRTTRITAVAAPRGGTLWLALASDAGRCGDGHGRAQGKSQATRRSAGTSREHKIRRNPGSQSPGCRLSADHRVPDSRQRVRDTRTMRKPLSGTAHAHGSARGVRRSE
jgi:hypothetical protein